MPFAIGGNQLVDTGYDVSNSCRFNDDDTAFLNKTLGTATNRKIWSYSTWIKRANLSSQQSFLSADTGSNTNSHIRFRADNAITWFHQVSGSDTYFLNTNQVFRDVSGWYNLVFVFNSTESTSTNRLKMYVNGSQVTSFSSTQYPSLNLEEQINNSVNHEIGRRAGGNDMPLDAYVCETHFIDGTAKLPTDFGEFNDNGVWIPKKYEGSYGNNGFYLEFKQTGTSANSSGIGADTSGNDNHFAVNNLTSTDITTDTCTNNFCTMNPLDVGSDLRDNGSFKEGNLEVTNGSTSGQANQQRVRGTFAVTKGKWYFEMKKLANSASIGVLAVEAAHGGTSANSMLVEYNDGGEIRFFNGSGRTTKTTGIDTYTTNDIVGCALDMDNRRAYFHKNGFYQGDPTPDPASSPSGAGQFGGIEVGFTMAPCGFDNSSGSAGKSSFNFGNPAFSISSGNSDSEGHGNFEYAVPSGYFALCTKNLAEYG